MRSPAVGALLLAPLLLTACTGEGASPQEEYARAADAVCQTAVEAGSGLERPRTPEAYVSSFLQTLSTAEQALDGLEALTPPQEDAAMLRAAFLTPLRQLVEAFQAALPDVQEAQSSENPVAALMQISPGAGIRIDSRYIEEYGMPSCARFVGRS